MRTVYILPLIGGLCIGLIFMFGAYRIQQDAFDKNYEHDRTVAVERVQKLAGALSKSMNVRLNLASSLAAFVTINRDFSQQEFDRFATLLEKDLPGILSLQLAPNGIVTYMTNREQHKKALGHNLFKDEERRFLVETSVARKSFTIAGPLALIQGGTAIIARRPLFFPEENSKEEVFWGFATILIDVGVLLRDADISNVEGNMLLAIRGKDGLGATGEVFYGDSAIFGSPLALSTVALPDGNWQLAGILKSNTLPDNLLFTSWYWVLTSLVALLISAGVYSILRRPSLLKSQVNLATESLRTTLNSIGDAVIATNMSGNVRRMNPIAEKLTGWPLKEALGRPLSEILKIVQPTTDVQRFNPVDTENEQEIVAHAANPTKLIARNGLEHQIALSSAPIKNDKGVIKGMVLVLRDVSEANALRQDLLESEERFRAFANIGADWLWEMDDQLRFSFFSDNIHRITGRPTSEYLGKTRKELQLGKGRDDWTDHLEDLINHRQFKDFRYTFENEDGRQFFWSISGKPHFDENGKFLGYRGTGTDITERKRLEEQLRRSNKMDAVGQLTGGIAHDFNNILGITLGNLELLQDTIPDGDKRQKLVKSALRGVTRGADITRKLLFFSRKSVNQVSLTAINPFIENLEDLIAKSLTVSIQVETDLAANLWRVAIDPGDLEDAILNLSLNARDAMPEGGTLHIKTQNEVLDDDFVRQNPDSKAGEFVMIAVSDTGSGMTDEIREKILEPFFTTKDPGKGTGLGLSMVYGFVQRSGGCLDVFSEVGKGTTVRLFIPRSYTKEVTPPQEKETPAAPAGGHETILVVDDEKELREVASSYLETLGYKTLTAENGKQAVALVSDHSAIDLVFSDVVMPGGMDGYQLANILHEKHPDLTVLLTSGFTSKQADLIHSENDYLVKVNTELVRKPYNLSDIAIAIRRALVAKA